MSARARSAACSSSGTAMTLARVVSFTSSTVLDSRSGKTFRTAWGRTTYRNVWPAVSPVERPASTCPAPTLSMPAR